MDVTDKLAASQYRDYVIYSELSKVEKVPEFKRILHHLAQQEFTHFQFWKKHSNQKEFTVNSLQIWTYKFLRKVMGLTFAARFLERHEQEMVEKYAQLLTETTDKSLRKKVKAIIDLEAEHEQELISQIKEERVTFISSIVLGLNDGLIEITGALVGFSLALRQNNLIALTGFITGLAASLSMASSAYMQAKYEEGKNARKVAVYTGLTYISVVLLLILPFVVLPLVKEALLLLLGIILVIIFSMSYYTAIIFRRSFRKQFLEMFVFSMGVAAITFTVGYFLRGWVGI